jgi:TrmH family RNA methyltransferase
MSTERITSLQNPHVKQLVRLRDRRPRDEAGQFLVEGFREVRRALAAGVKLQELYYGPDWFLGANELVLIEEAQSAGALVFELSKGAFAKVSYRDRPDGLLAVAPQWKQTLGDLDQMFRGDATPTSRPTPKNATRASRLHVPPETQSDFVPEPRTAPTAEPPFVLVVEAIEKPGNLGTLLRGADAAGVDAVVVCDPVTDIFNPNVVRSSTGVLFSMPVIVAESREVRSWLRTHGIRAVATTPAAPALYTDSDLRGPLAIIMGSEQYGLSEFWLKESDLLVRIPMAGQADSLNVAMAAIITLFEAARQRGHQPQPDSGSSPASAFEPFEPNGGAGCP